MEGPGTPETQGFFERHRSKWPFAVLFVVVIAAAPFAYGAIFSARAEEPAPEPPVTLDIPSPPPQVDHEDYDSRLSMLAHADDVTTEPQAAVEPPTPPEEIVTPDATVTPDPPEPLPLWPVTDLGYPELGAILPFHRIVAYYGNFYSTGMGVLGEYAPDTVLAKLQEEVKKWEDADPETPVMPGIDYIAVTAQGSAGADGKYRLRMPGSQIEKALDMASQVDGIVILEVQPGLADVMTEVRALEPYLALPNVMLAIDPEFVMITRGMPPGTVVGTIDAAVVNEAIEYLGGLVREHDLPPKVLVVHRYTRPMLTNASEIAPSPEVQVVIDMDGWGPPDKKIASYESYVASEPVQFTGFKLFYKNDLRREGSRLMTPEEVLGLTPSPIFIQYQ